MNLDQKSEPGDPSNLSLKAFPDLEHQNIGGLAAD